MPYLADMVRMTVSGTPGTGTITLGSAVSGFQSFASASVPNKAIVSYSISDTGGGWEVGRGTYTSSGTTLSRGPIYSSNSNAAVNLTSSAVVWVTVLAEDMAPVFQRPVAWNGAAIHP